MKKTASYFSIEMFRNEINADILDRGGPKSSTQKP